MQDQKANRALTTLWLNENKVGNAGATALADALQATVLTCEPSLSSACACCDHRCPFTKCCEELGVAKLLCSLCPCFCVFLLS